MSGRLLEHLPGIYQTNEPLARFLAPFETVLLGPGNGLRDRILDLPQLLDPHRAPEGFLPWLAGWVGLSLRVDLTPERQRVLIAKAVPLYAWRGTMYSVKTLLELVTSGQVTIMEPQIEGLRIGVDAVIGISTRLGRELPHYFQVTIEFPAAVGEHRSWLEILARETIDLAKPAHTYYGLQLQFSEERSEY